MGKLGIVALRRRSDRGHGGIGIFFGYQKGFPRLNVMELWRKEREVTQWYHQDPDKEGGVTVNIQRDSYDYASINEEMWYIRIW
ncbi:unnamed protein product, partial [Brassica oleracea]